MTYVQGFLVPVPTEKKDAYRRMAADTAPLFLEFGATRIVEAWGVEVPEGKRTDMRRAVQATPDESIVFAWVEYPDKAACEAAGQRMQSDERMKVPDDLPFDPRRMIIGGFDAIVTSGPGGQLGYIDGMVAAVPKDKRAAYVDFAEATTPAFTRHGMTTAVDTWTEDLADGAVTDFKRAVAVEDGEAVVFSWVGWPDKATRDQAWGAMMSEPEMQGAEMPFDGSRMIFGGFEPILDTDAN